MVSAPIASEDHAVEGELMHEQQVLITTAVRLEHLQTLLSFSPHNLGLPPFKMEHLPPAYCSAIDGPHIVKLSSSYSPLILMCSEICSNTRTHTLTETLMFTSVEYSALPTMTVSPPEMGSNMNNPISTSDQLQSLIASLSEKTINNLFLIPFIMLAVFIPKMIAFITLWFNSSTIIAFKLQCWKTTLERQAKIMEIKAIEYMKACQPQNAGPQALDGAEQQGNNPPDRAVCKALFSFAKGVDFSSAEAAGEAVTSLFSIFSIFNDAQEKTENIKAITEEATRFANLLCFHFQGKLDLDIDIQYVLHDYRNNIFSVSKQARDLMAMNEFKVKVHSANVSKKISLIKENLYKENTILQTTLNLRNAMVMHRLESKVDTILKLLTPRSDVSIQKPESQVDKILDHPNPEQQEGNKELKEELIKEQKKFCIGQLQRYIHVWCQALRHHHFCIKLSTPATHIQFLIPLAKKLIMGLRRKWLDRFSKFSKLREI
ncbi:hypothetical protein M422DRAFT_259145 [Sphaerobolus stellatus SS14]|uniref:Uncharacterized protein n=1 Tax=Sphaerobolus stellatus (strain SS14) TaxID=990650 RepID=A0A0C9VKG1_SPHS4|nr:hypothetical protein M422DRAFT_259145 [Sphaerobolus stellatus SS14]